MQTVFPSFVRLQIFLLLVVLSIPTLSAFASEDSEIGDATTYMLAGYPVELHDRVENPHDYEASASIEFVFENISGDNYWESKEHVGTASPMKNFVTHQSYFIEHPGKFYIHMKYEIDGKTAKNPNTLEFIVFEEESKAVTNGCYPDHQIIVKPDYSEAVCVFDGSVAKLVMRGWIAD